ncbi:pulmonary surfactant-associated protein B isoform X2 [Spea bombifrons]|uniref:pulmonary surfactant-associated protein B isoform X2 n=1 Tax=Spea bombifrons TaxID=233779 RepID=UPI00234933CC|nr:pulmonary surfactant-associated protein B isoform X2 [Spea bombifrons]
MEGTRVTWVCVLCVIAGVSGNVLVKDGCAQGPEFWCQDLVTAAQCGAIDHCKDTVWKEGEETLCGECKQIVAIMLNMVKASSIQDTVKSFLHKECSHLPITPLIVQCHQLVEQYQGILVDVLESQIKPQAICSSLTFCSSDQSNSWNSDQLTNHILEKVLPLIQENVHNVYTKASQEQGGNGDFPIPMPMCWMCKSFIGRFEAAIPKDAIAKSATALCLVLPGKIAGVCQCLVERYTVIILDLILGKLGPKLVCGLLFMCSTELPVMPVLSHDITCDMCLAVTYKVKPTLGENATEADIKAALLRVCADPELDRKECQNFIQEHLAQLIQILQKPWDAKRTCKDAGFCPAVTNPAPEHTGCAAGPLYWCRSLETAKECEALGHCLTHVWH